MKARSYALATSIRGCSCRPTRSVERADEEAPLHPTAISTLRIRVAGNCSACRGNSPQQRVSCAVIPGRKLLPSLHRGRAALVGPAWAFQVRRCSAHRQGCVGRMRVISD